MTEREDRQDISELLVRYAGEDAVAVF